MDGRCGGVVGDEELVGEKVGVRRRRIIGWVN